MLPPHGAPTRATERFKLLLAELITYPETRFSAEAPERWLSLCEELRLYQPPPPTLTLPAERKWEGISGLQKSIRRGRWIEAHRCVSAIASMPDENAYLWRRFCVIACEDVGPADDLLTIFVVACATIFGSKKNSDFSYHLFCFLAQHMCGAPSRSRTYCSLSIVEAAMSSPNPPQQRTEDAEALAAIMESEAESCSSPKLLAAVDKDS